MSKQLTISNIKNILSKYHGSSIENPDLLRAAVLVPIVRSDNGLELLLTVRSDAVEHHKGQIAFPGGSVEPEDYSLEETALRESQEEIALPPEAVEILGRIDDMWSPAGFSIAPVVGFIRDLPSLEIQPAEVSEYFTVPLRFFLNESNGYTKPYSRGGEEINVWFYDYGEYTIWGVTAFIIRNLKSILETELAKT